MTRRRTLHLPPLLGTLAAAVLVACVVALFGPSEKAEATFPGKNGRIAYMDSFSLYTIHPDGSGKTKVTTTTAGCYSIDYSPTGKKITYTDYEGFDGKDTEIYTINVGGGAKTKVTNNSRGDEDSSYSPNGKRIAYAGWDGHDLEIYTIGVNGKNRVRLTNNATNDGFPDYSPDGKKIAYTGRRFFEPDSEIYTIKVNGRHRTKVTNNNATDYWPSYSPDGKKITFIQGCGRNPDIYTKNISGGFKSNKVMGSKYLYSNPACGIRQ